MPLQPCSSCGCHHRSLSCPVCGVPVGRALSAAAVLLSLAAGCGDKEPDSSVQALYGVADTSASMDQDGDGFSTMDGDCNDDDAAIFPGATDTPGDGIDSDCDNADD